MQRPWGRIKELERRTSGEESGRDGSREVVESRPWTALQALAMTGFYSEKGETTEVLLQLSYMIL